MRKIILILFAFLLTTSVFADRDPEQHTIINDSTESLTIIYVITNKAEYTKDFQEDLANQEHTAIIPGKDSGQLNELSFTSEKRFYRNHLHIITANTATKNLFDDHCYLYGSGSLIVMDHGKDNPHLTCISTKNEPIPAF